MTMNAVPLMVVLAIILQLWNSGPVSAEYTDTDEEVRDLYSTKALLHHSLDEARSTSHCTTISGQSSSIVGNAGN